MKNISKLIASIVICQMAGIVGAFFTMPGVSEWYSTLNKPSFNPPSFVFAPAWTILFLLMGVALYLVWSKKWQPELPAQGRASKAWNRFSQKLLTGTWREENIVLIFAVQLGLNILWSVLFFYYRLPGLAFFELIMLWFAILYTIVNFYRVSKLAGYLLIPYILWVTFAGYLNYTIWMMN